MTAMTNAERQKRFRERKAKEGQMARTFFVTDNEAFFIERLLKTMRDLNAVPAMVRDTKGRLKPVDL